MLKTRGCGGSGPFRPGSIHPRELLFTEPCDQRAGFGTGYRDVDFAEQIEVDRFRYRGEGELEATFIDKDGDEEEYDLEYMTFDRHVLVWVVED